MNITLDFAKILENVKLSFKSPSAFVKKYFKDTTWQSTLAFYTVTTAIGWILFFFYVLLITPNIAEYLPQGADIAESGIATLGYYIMTSFVLGLLTSFVWGGLMFAILKLFKVKSDFNKSYALITYSRTPSYIIGWAPIANLVALFYSMYLLFLGLEVNYKVKRSKAAIISVSSFVGVLVLYVALISLVVSIGAV